MRRLAGAAGVLLLVAALLALGWGRWPGASTASTSSLAGAPAGLPGTTTTIATTTAAATSTTTSIATTTTSPPPGIAVAEITAEQAHPSEFFGALLALSAQEAWAAMYTDAPDGGGTGLIGHVVDGTWTLYALGGAERVRVMGLALAPDGTVWAATDIGVFSFDGLAWIRRFAPAGGVAVGEDGSVWAGGKLVQGNGLGSLWLARWDGVSWERLDPSPEEALEPWGQAAIAVLPSGEAWIAHRPGYWVEEDLTRYHGAAMVVVDVPGVPDDTPDNGQPAVRVFEVEADSSGGLWAVGYLASDPKQTVLARFDGVAWSLAEWPFPPPAELPLDIDISAGPDGVMWFACNDGIRSLDGATWQSHLEGQLVYNVAVAPDGAVWYSDETGVHVLEAL